MEMRKDFRKRLASMLMKARYDSGLSQEAVALEIGVAKKTLANWEKGVSEPTFTESYMIFHALGLNPMPYYLGFLFPQEFQGIKGGDSDERIESAFNALMENLPVEWKRGIIYMFFGGHGSSPYAVLQLFLAYLHTPLEIRSIEASTIVQNYELHLSHGDIICKENILPDLETLNMAIDLGKQSARNNQYGYACRAEFSKDPKDYPKYCNPKNCSCEIMPKKENENTKENKKE